MRISKSHKLGMRGQLAKISPSRRQGSLRGGRRGWAALCVLLTVSLAAAGLSVSPVSAQAAEGASARIWARKLASGNVEFGLAVYAVGSSSGANVAVTNRYFPYESAAGNIGRWYNSEAVVLSSGADRALASIRARRLASGNLEFGLRVYGVEDQVWTPRARYFVYSPAVQDIAAYSSPLYFRQHDRACLDGAVPSAATNLGLFRDCEVLLVVKDAFVVTDRFRSDYSSWAGTNPISDWTRTWVRVTLTDSRVSELSLMGNPVTGTISKELGKLDQLVSLEIAGAMTGSIPPELGNLSNLETLLIGSSSLTGSIPAELGNLTNLETLDLNIGSMTGSIPSELGNLTKLKKFRLVVRELAGSIPAELGNLTDLETFEIGKSGLDDKLALAGSIPAELGNLGNLRGLSITKSNLAGSIPAELGDLEKLEILDLENNALTGSIPGELGDLEKLTRLFLRYNDLDGAIPPELGNLSKLEQLRLSYNELSGSIPPELGSLSSLQVLHLDDNNLENAIPSALSSLSVLEALDVSGNSLSGDFPAALGALAPSNGGKLDVLNIRNNPDLTGCIPSDLRGMTRFHGIGHLTFCP